MRLLTEIKNVIKEELGVSQEVSKHVSALFKEIIKDSKLNGIQKSPSIKSGNFFYRFDGISVKVFYKIIYLDDVDNFPDDEFTASTEFLSPNYFELYTTLLYDKANKKYVDFDGTLQHEFEHLYQQARAGHPFLDRDSSRELYEKASRLIETATKKSEMIVALTVYYNCKFEKDAFANELYKQIMDNGRDDPFTILKNNMVYQNVQVIRQIILENDHSAKLEPIVKTYFGKTFNWLHNIAGHMVMEYTKKVGKVMAKALKDIEEQNKKRNSTDGGRLSIKREKIDKGENL